jgi:uncharacterized protein with HEPN domain
VPRRDTVERLKDILGAIERIVGYTDGLGYEQFCADGRTIEAVQYNFIVIGEAVAHLPPDLTESRPEIPWSEMRGLRNVVAHAYFAVSSSVLWQTARSDLVPLVAMMRELIGELNRGVKN